MLLLRLLGWWEGKRAVSVEPSFLKPASAHMHPLNVPAAVGAAAGDASHVAAALLQPQRSTRGEAPGASARQGCLIGDWGKRTTTPQRTPRSRACACVCML